MSTLDQSEAIAQRLALLLTGQCSRADAVMAEVMLSQPILAQMQTARIRRLVILRARDIAGLRTRTAKPWLMRVREAQHRARGAVIAGDAEATTEVFDDLALIAFKAASMLERQPMEAWLLHRVEDLELRQVARAMDCSTSAVQRHLEQAEGSLGQTLGVEYPRAIEQLREQSRSLGALPSLQRSWERRIGRRSVRLWSVRIIVGVVLIASVYLIWWLL
jgi:hypothetical protein